MELAQYVATLRERWLTITVVAVLGLAGAVLSSLLMTPQYTATTSLYVSTRTEGGTPSDLEQGGNFTRQQVGTYARIVTTPIVLGPVLDDPRFEGLTAEELTETITADVPAETSLVSVSVSDSDPVRATALADRVAESFSAAVEDLETSAEGESSPVLVTVVAPATLPTSPSSPNVPLSLVVGLVAGAVLGLALAVAREHLDGTVRGEREARTVVDRPPLGRIPLPGADDHPLGVELVGDGPRAEALRQLRTTLRAATTADQVRSFVVTSSVPGEGKTTTAVELGAALVEVGVRVVVVDGDLRTPGVGVRCGVEGPTGLTSVLTGRVGLEDVLTPVGSSGRFDVVVAGTPTSRPSELLESPIMRQVLRTLEDDYDVVIIDAPPLVPVADPSVLAGLTGAALLVVGTGQVDRHQLARAVTALEGVRATLLGYVLNTAPAPSRPARPPRGPTGPVETASGEADAAAASPAQPLSPAAARSTDAP